MSSSTFSTISGPNTTNASLPADLTEPWRGGYEFFKRAIDLGGSIFLLIAFTPIFVIAAMGVKLTGPGPVLFRQKRLGRGGKLFRCYKFRTMVADAESRLAESEELLAQFDETYKIKNDPRVTPFGAFLRKTSLDEFPQLWNVVRGEMSLIGPRPIVAPEVSKYGAQAQRLLSVKPGLGGVWQVNGRSDTTYDERVAMDLEYVETRSLRLDLILLVKTALVVVKGRGAY
jgi:lipopolysaccharide/colanic/teichoic acid biosynthesis glycosyltransferase